PRPSWKELEGPCRSFPSPFPRSPLRCHSCESARAPFPRFRLKYFGCERYNLHEFLSSKLARYRSKYAGTDRLLLVVDQHGRIVIESDIGSIRSPYLLCPANHHGLHHLAFFYLGVGDRLLDGNHDNVAD